MASQLMARNEGVINTEPTRGLVMLFLCDDLQTMNCELNRHKDTTIFYIIFWRGMGSVVSYYLPDRTQDNFGGRNCTIPPQ